MQPFDSAGNQFLYYKKRNHQEIIDNVELLEHSPIEDGMNIKFWVPLRNINIAPTQTPFPTGKSKTFSKHKCFRCIVNFREGALPKTNMSPFEQESSLPSFQASNFRCYVNFREGKSTTCSSNQRLANHRTPPSCRSRRSMWKPWKRCRFRRWQQVWCGWGKKSKGCKKNDGKNLAK